MEKPIMEVSSRWGESCTRVTRVQCPRKAELSGRRSRGNPSSRASTTGKAERRKPTSPGGYAAEAEGYLQTERSETPKSLSGRPND
jgi:hypothetical protein